MEAGCIIFLSMGGTRVSGLMVNTMATELRAGREGVDIKGSTGKDCGTGMAFIGFIQGILMLGSGVMARVMALVCRLVLMGAPMLASLSAESNMALAFTISGIILNFVGNS